MSITSRSFTSRIIMLLLSLTIASCGKEMHANADSGQQPLSPTPAPAPEDPEEPTPPLTGKSWKVAIVSDMNRSYGSTDYTSQLDAAIEHIQSSGVSLVLSTGDMVAGQKSGLNYTAMWNAFHNHVTKPLQSSGIPLLPSPGNHDASAGSSFQTERALYRSQFNGYPIERFNSQRPQNERLQFLSGVEQNYPLNYAATMGSAVFIALDATAVGPLVNDQLGWLEEVLASSSTYPIKIVFGHVPLYPFAFNRASDYLGRGNSNYALEMEEILERHQVTYYFSGHHHVYYPGHRNGQVRYVSVPLLGSGKRKLLTKDRTHSSLSEEAFIYLTFNDRGEHSFETLESPSFEKITWTGLPSAISIPSSSSSDCSGCGSFPQSLFLNKSLRTLFERINPLQ